MTQRRRRLLLTLLWAVALLSGSLVMGDVLQAGREERANRQLAEQVQGRRAQRSTPELPGGTQAEGEERPPKYAASGVLYQYDPLWQQNPDLAGWLTIDGTQLDNPVMFTPDDPEYYLRRGFDREYARSGSLFVSEGCTEQGNHVLIYGHNMRNGTMFGELDAYQSQEYAQAHPLIRFDTLREERVYQVLAVFRSRVYWQEERGVFRYYQYADLSSRESFEEYVAQVKRAALFDTGVEAAYGDELLTLSTCSYHTQNGRFVLVAVRLRDGGDGLAGHTLFSAT